MQVQLVVDALQLLERSMFRGKSTRVALLPYYGSLPPSHFIPLTHKIILLNNFQFLFPKSNSFNALFRDTRLAVFIMCGQIAKQRNSFNNDI